MTALVAMFEIFMQLTKILSHDQDTIHAGKGCVEMGTFCMAALMFPTGQRIKARTHANAEIPHFPTCCIIRTWEALGLWPRAPRP